MIYGYLRVSTDMQDANSQKQGVEKFAKDKGWTIDKYISDEGVSGGTDPSKRKLGAVLEGLQAGDIIIAAEISRLGRDLYMVMDILHHCMKVGCTIYTVKDNFVLADDIQSKVLSFAFGLAAEIERQMIRHRTREGLMLRMKSGVLLGRPIGKITSDEALKYAKDKERFTQMCEWGMTPRQISRVIGCDRNTVGRLAARWGIKNCAFTAKERKQIRQKTPTYKDGDYKIVSLDREKMLNLIERDMILPAIALEFPEYTYEQIYDTVLCDEEFNAAYRRHGQLKIKKS